MAEDLTELFETELLFLEHQPYLSQSGQLFIRSWCYGPWSRLLTFGPVIRAEKQDSPSLDWLWWWTLSTLTWHTMSHLGLARSLCQSSLQGVFDRASSFGSGTMAEPETLHCWTCSTITYMPLISLQEWKKWWRCDRKHWNMVMTPGLTTWNLISKTTLVCQHLSWTTQQLISRLLHETSSWKSRARALCRLHCSRRLRRNHRNLWRKTTMPLLQNGWTWHGSYRVYHLDLVNMVQFTVDGIGLSVW